MILKFSKQINGKPTNFIEKIWKALIEEVSTELQCQLDFFHRLSPEEKTKIYHLNPEVYRKSLPKIHTLRKDSNDMWKVKEKITFALEDDKESEPEVFAPDAYVVTIQKITIEWLPTIREGDEKKPVVWIDDKIFYDEHFNYGNSRMRRFAYNDGFDSLEYFFEFFKDDFTGKIIHWTNFKY